MANKLKKKSASKAEGAPLKTEKEEKLDLRQIARDERTWKIVGAVSLLVSLLLFTSFISYFFTWKEDQDVVHKGASILFGEDVSVSNLLGRLGALTAHFFIYKGFGVASLLICTFFFILGVNLLFERKVWSLWRNLRYVTVGMTVLSVSLAFLTPGTQFPFGGKAGDYINNWLIGLIGVFGTGLLLAVIALAYIIWQFNPKFNLPEKKPKELNPEVQPELEPNQEDPVLTIGGKTINDLYAEDNGKGNRLKKGASVILPPVKEEESPVFSIIEKEEEPVLIPEPIVEPVQPVAIEMPVEPEPELPPKKIAGLSTPVTETSDLELEIKSTPETHQEEKEKTYENLPPYEPTLDLRDYKYPKIDLLETYASEKIVQDTSELETHKNQIINTLKNYDILIQKISATVGPTVTLYEIVPAAGVRISRIKNLEDDIALSLAALGIRIIAPIPGKGTIGIEVPNIKKSVVSMKTLLSSEKFQHNTYSLPIALGKKIDNENYIVDLTSMPHLLMAGATGQGKSVGLNAILVSLLYKKHPSQLKLVLIDPKKVELSVYRLIEKHFLAKLPGDDEAIITDTKKVVHTLNALCIEMDNRYDLLKEAGARNIKEYNEKFVKRKLNPQKGHQYLPFIVLVIDEFADLIMTAGKEIEMPIARLAQLARAVGIHLIIATQRPSVNIITGTIKANFPSRVAFKVSSKIDSRTILDAGGAEQLIGKGDMLISHHGELIRLQCAFVDTPEVERVVEHVGNQRGYPQAFLLPEYIDEKDLEGKDFDINDRDSLFEDAARVIVQNQIGSTSLLQRRMKLGYNRAGRLMDQLESAGVVGPSQGSKAREVLIKTEAELEQHLSNLSL